MYSKFILTAGHCVVSQDGKSIATPSNVNVIIRTTYYQKNVAENFISGVRAVHVHPLYNGSVKNGNDATILELRNEVVMDGTYARAVQLNSEQYYTAGTETTAAGWGQNR